MVFICSKKIAACLFLTVLLSISVLSVSADFNSTMDSVLEEKNVSYGSAAYMLLVGTGVLGEEASVQEAAEKMSSKFPSTKKNYDNSLTIGDLSFMIMNAYNMNGGLMYSLFPGPRYAVRELRHKKILQGKSYSTMHISGERACRILGRVLEMEEAENEK